MASITAFLAAGRFGVMPVSQAGASGSEPLILGPDHAAALVLASLTQPGLRPIGPVCLQCLLDPLASP